MAVCDSRTHSARYDVAAILDAEARLRANRIHLHAQDVASEIGVPEAALVEAHRLQLRAFALRKPGGVEGYGAILRSLAGAGGAMALTRNHACVSEKHGAYTEPAFHGAMGQVVGEIDLRLFLAHWVYGYAVTEGTRGRARLSLQFFDAFGDAVHKVYVTDDTDLERFEAVVAEYADTDRAPAQLKQRPEEPAEVPDESIDKVGFLNAWSMLQHSHDFFGMLRTFQVSRHQAMRLGAPVFTRRVSAATLDALLHAAAEQHVPLMVFVGNRGCIQIFSGAIGHVKRLDQWLNVLDPRFTLHLRTDLIETAWLVRKPSFRGDVHSLELFDASGFCFAQIFGERKPGTTERDDWRSLVTALASG